MYTYFEDHQLDTPLLLTVVLLVLMLMADFFGTPGLQRTLTETLIRLVVVIGMYLFIGNSGVMSFGHVAFMGVGAYVAAWATMDPAIKPFVLPGLPEFLLVSSTHWLLATLFAGLLTAMVGLLCGALILRLTGIAASIASFALLAIFNVVYSNWDSVTAGTSSIVGIPTPVQLWQAGAFAIATLVLAHFYSISRLGLALRSVREEPVASLSCGVNAYWHLLIAFVLSTFICGVGGALDAQYLGVVNPDAYYLSRTFFCLAMLVVGGVSTLSGAVTGVLVLSALTELFNRLEAGIQVGALSVRIPAGAQEILVGVLMIGVLIGRPKGLVGRKEWHWKQGT